MIVCSFVAGASCHVFGAIHAKRWFLAHGQGASLFPMFNAFALYFILLSSFFVSLLAFLKQNAHLELLMLN